MEKLKKISVLGLMLVMTACGGNGSSSSNGGGVTNAKAASGTENVSVSFQGVGVKSSGVLQLDATVGDVTITIVDVGNNQYSGTVSGSGSFTATGIQVLGDIGGGITCGDITVNYSGTIDGDVITGSSEGSVTCSGAAGSFTLSQQGTFSMTIS